jgi:hypothetical protein
MHAPCRLETLPKSLLDEGKLSELQLEGVLYAVTAHQGLLPDGQRVSKELDSTPPCCCCHSPILAMFNR